MDGYLVLRKGKSSYFTSDYMLAAGTLPSEPNQHVSLIQGHINSANELELTVSEGAYARRSANDRRLVVIRSVTRVPLTGTVRDLYEDGIQQFMDAYFASVQKKNAALLTSAELMELKAGREARAAVNAAREEEARQRRLY